MGVNYNNIKENKMPRVFKTLSNGVVIEKFSGKRNRSPESIANGNHERTTYKETTPPPNDNGEQTTSYELETSGSGSMEGKAEAEGNGSATRFSVPTGVGIYDVSVEVDNVVTPFTILRGSSSEGLDEVVISPAPAAFAKVEIYYTVDKKNMSILTYDVAGANSGYALVERNSSIIDPPKVYFDGVEQTYTIEIGLGFEGTDKINFDSFASTGQRVTIVYCTPPEEANVFGPDFWNTSQTGLGWTNSAAWQLGFDWFMNGPSNTGEYIFTKDPNALLLASEKKLEVTIIYGDFGPSRSINVYGETELGVTTPVVTIDENSPKVEFDSVNHPNTFQYTFDVDFTATGDVATAGIPRRLYFDQVGVASGHFNVTNIVIDDNVAVAPPLTGDIDQSGVTVDPFDLNTNTTATLDNWAGPLSIVDGGPTRQVFKVDGLAANTTYTAAVGDWQGFDSEMYAYPATGGASIAHNDETPSGDHPGSTSQFTFTTDATGGTYYFGAIAWEDDPFNNGETTDLHFYITQGTGPIPAFPGTPPPPSGDIDQSGLTNETFDLENPAPLNSGQWSGSFTLDAANPKTTFYTNAPMPGGATLTVGVASNDGLDTELYMYTTAGGPSIAYNDDGGANLPAGSSQVSINTGAGGAPFAIGVMVKGLDGVTHNSTQVRVYWHLSASDVPSLPLPPPPVNGVDSTYFTVYSQFTPFTTTGGAGAEVVTFQGTSHDFPPEIRSSNYPSALANTSNTQIQFQIGFPVGIESIASLHNTHMEIRVSDADFDTWKQTIYMDDTPDLISGGFRWYNISANVIGGGFTDVNFSRHDVNLEGHNDVKIRQMGFV